MTEDRRGGQAAARGSDGRGDHDARTGRGATDEGPAPAPPGSSPRRRRDARRNRELLTDAAHEVFTEQGLEAPFDVIARRAGIGNATLYRHFPTRAALVNAVFRDLLTHTMTVGEQARTAEDAWSGLCGYLAEIFTVLASDRGANDLMTTHLEGVQTLETVHAHNRETVDILLRRGHTESTIRTDVTTEDVLFSFAALGRAVPALTAATTPDAWRRPLTLFLDALRAPSLPPSPLPTPPLTPPQLATTLHELAPHGGSRPGPHEKR
ncbi:TetR/AcrR family transcriptional regulator [Streptomyces reniochalinae]|uniref:TetR/AcrR family transcriptional regulator n=1 Tax=Streptomyces reniochalinae TaxID=2250578 RepID=A0A367F1K5_9ACTN|nr:helix-turn-helix domain-containing protein [Streptomyces reniochalinae]RCG24213.1 TetR/AcrR family transcriptional regulator [Streptomyces reniochalinae]